MRILKAEQLIFFVFYWNVLCSSLPSADAGRRKKNLLGKYISTSEQASKLLLSLKKLQTLLDKEYRKKNNRFRRKRNVHVNFGQNLLTTLPTNSMRCRIYCRSGYYLQLLPNGAVRGARESYNTYSFLELQSFGPSLVRIKGLQSRRYLTIDAHGKLKAKRFPRLDESLFKEIQEENSYNSYSSFKYYFDVPYDIFLGIRGTGNVKKTWKTYPGQMATQFLVIKAL